MIHVVNPGSRDTQAKVHAATAPDAIRTLCGGTNMFRDYHGQRFLIMQECSLPVDCEPCIKQFQMIARNELAKLTSADAIEEVMELLAKLRANGG